METFHKNKNIFHNKISKKKKEKKNKTKQNEVLDL